MSESEMLKRDQVLQHLARHLDDTTLEALFPGADQEQLRQLIAGAGQAPGRKPASPVPPSPVVAGGCYRLFTDGASRGNPGQAGAGAVLFSPAGDELIVHSSYLGTCTNNVAEYRALILGLDEALQFGCEELAICLDSELIVRQIQGRYKVKNETLLPLFQQVQQRLSRLRKWSVSHVPRAQNSRADQLANQGIDGRND
ncbi:MAG: ribonuclease HI family protein [Desulfobulbus sp.]|nr:ribonuclease HI family protein [Desulfobulbus sp.]